MKISLPAPLTRRNFLARSAATLGVLAAAKAIAGDPWTCPIGVCESIKQWPALQQAGGAYIEEAVGRFLNPKLADDAFAKAAADFKTKNIPVYSCNSFLPREIKLVGPEPKHDAAIEYAGKALARAKELGVQIVVLGSGDARNIPDGFDRAKAEEQFVQILVKLGALAQTHGVTVAMESLNRGETNFGNTVRDCLKYIKAANQPRVRLVADMFHMLKEDESPDILLEAGSLVVHCHLAEKAQRTPPGIAGDDFKPYLRALKKVGYQGRISIECKWKKFATEIGPAVAALKKQIDAVGAES